MTDAFLERIEAGLAYERGRRDPPAEFPALPLIPAGRYTDTAFMELEREHLWGHSWVYALHLDQLPEVGSYRRWDRLGVPLLIVRTGDREVRAFHNVCRHRGGPLVLDDCGRRESGFTCRFHGWSYALDGSLRGVRDEADFVDLDREALGLSTVRCECLGNWVFVNADVAAPSLLESLGPFAEHMRAWGLHECRHVDSRVFRVRCNVKLMIENFLEVYHLGTVHGETVNRFLDHRGTHIMLWEGGHSLMLTPHRDPDWVDPGTRGLPEFEHAPDLLRTTNLSYNVFPNLVTPAAPSGLPFLVCWPIGSDQVEIESHWFAPPGKDSVDPVWENRLENFGRILLEDMAIVEHQQQAFESAAIEGTRVGYQERRIYHWHEELDRRIGGERIPHGLRVEPRLADWFDRPEVGTGPAPLRRAESG